MEMVKVTITIEAHAQHDGDVGKLADAITRRLDVEVMKLANNERKDIGLIRTAKPKVRIHSAGDVTEMVKMIRNHLQAKVDMGYDISPKIEAIKQHRAICGTSLADSKRWVDDYPECYEKIK
jgi:ribosomal protein L7/L12